MRTSNRYVMTVDINSAADMQQLQAIRKAVSISNKTRQRKQYVKLHARGSRLEATWKSGNPSNYHRYCRELPLRFAERIDVYIYDRSAY